MRRQKKKKKKNIQTKRLYFLNCYDSAYASTDVVNQAAKVTPAVIKAATNDIDNIATDRMNQIIPLPKILKGAVEDVYQTPFRLLGNFGERQFNKIKRKILRSNTFY